MEEEECIDECLWCYDAKFVRAKIRALLKNALLDNKIGSLHKEFPRHVVEDFVIPALETIVYHKVRCL